jgi:hypothetical protein
VATSSAAEPPSPPKPGTPAFLGVEFYRQVLEVEGIIAGGDEDLIEIHCQRLDVPPSAVPPGKIVHLWRGEGSERAQILAMLSHPAITFALRTIASLQSIDHRRSFARVPIAPAPALLVAAFSSRLVALHATVIDISGGGCGIVTARPLPPATRAWIRLRYPRSRTALAVEAEVRSCRSLARFHHLGIMFVGIDNAAREALIRELVAEERHQLAALGLKG